VGDAYIDEHVVYGPALIEAYEAEQQFARDPRIILTASATETFRKRLLTYPEFRRSRWYHQVLTDADGQIFLNYLEGAVEFEHDIGYPHTEFLERHRDILIERLKLFTSAPRVWAKYYWSARYHNFFCSERVDFEEHTVNLSALAPAPRRRGE
jgi:hypothetical protein